MNALQEFETYLHNKGRSVLTIKGYCSDIRCFALWFEQTKKEPFALQAVTSMDVMRYCHMEGIKNSTSNRRLASLSAFMRWAADTGVIGQDPTLESVPVRPPRRVPVKYLDKEQQLALLQAIGRNLNIAYTRYPKRWRTHQRDASVVIFLLDTGLRIHEALNLRMKDLDIDKQKGRVTVREKGKVSRSVPLSTEALKALKVWLSVRRSLDNEYVWVAVEPKEATDNMALSARTLQKIVLRAGQDADLPHLTPNILRYTFAKNLVDRGVGLEKVAALLGVGLRTAALAYFAVSKPSDDDLEQAIAKI